jgi:transcriptional regulator with XRE-family HTH domain
MGLKSLRLEKGWSQEQLAEISGLSERTIQRAERGEAASLETVRALAASFELSSGQLRDLMQPPTETPNMAANDTSSAASEKPLLTTAVKRLLIGGAVYLGVITWLAIMQVFAGWDPELLPWLALTGAGLLATFAFATLGGGEGDAED